MPSSPIFPREAFVPALLVVGHAVYALVRPAVPASLLSILFADTEVSTNISFMAALDAPLETVSVTPDGTVFIIR